ncbi:TetR/AcrR family transcriptional regulator [Burkholderia sp. Ac-20353]|uniref:TetR/AcrR family transcriptional regulator n=1 Tax=Burkholderia sp. Ac-20353 TaxID=2703894 RepID=UPI00197BD0AF|nr:TetR/AcrR family transcriptional regulator [Burkholderia sp. Ac-20353]MBN3786736.1 TetR/AcrR family transcriptional regulator [Burkholderia sp. Ac-20353]
MTTTPSPARARTTQSERIEATQRKIIESAQRLLREEGFKSATLQAIARGANVSLGALQHHFESRDALMERLVDEAISPLGELDGVWPDAALPLRERAEIFVTRAWTNIFGATSYLTAWSLFFGCKATPSIFGRIDAKRVNEDRKFFAMFLDAFPELDKHHPYPKGFTASVFSTLRGLGVFELFDVTEDDRQQELDALVETIVRACSPVAGEVGAAAPRRGARRGKATGRD